MIKFSELSEELQAKLKATDDIEQQKKMLIEGGYDVPAEIPSEEELEELSKAELSEEELENIAGGKWTDFLKQTFTLGLTDNTCSKFRCKYCGYEGVGNNYDGKTHGHYCSEKPEKAGYCSNGCGTCCYYEVLYCNR